MKHKHAELMAAYAADAQTTDKPWELWECRVPRSIGPKWDSCGGNPVWSVDCEYRRKPQERTLVLNTGGVQVLQNALGVQPKTNAQIACDLLGKAHAELEAHSAEICEPNVDHIQKLVWSTMQLLSKESNNEN